jgi:hypothetical protein
MQNPLRREEDRKSLTMNEAADSFCRDAKFWRAGCVTCGQEPSMNSS